MHRGPSTDKAQDFKGTLKKLIRYISKFKVSLAIVFIVAILSTIFSIVGPKILGNATQELYVGVINILLLFNNSLVFIRIGRYFEIFEVTQFTLGMRAYSTKNVQRYIISAMFLALMIFYWYYRFIVLGDGETYPYLIDPLWNKPV